MHEMSELWRITPSFACNSFVLARIFGFENLKRFGVRPR